MMRKVFTTKSILVRVSLCLIFLISTASLRVIVDGNLKESSDRYMKIKGIDSIVESMIKSPYDPYLSFYRIGKDDNHLGIDLAEGGIEVEYSTEYGVKSEKYLNPLKEILAMYSIDLIDHGIISNNSYTYQKYTFEIIAAPEHVGELLRNIVVKTFELNDEDGMHVHYSNEPSTWTGSNRNKPQNVSGEKLIQAFEKRERVYLGEYLGLIRSCPVELEVDENGLIRMNDEIWLTSYQELDVEFLEKFRRSQVQFDENTVLR